MSFALVGILVFAIPWSDMIQLSYEVQASRVFTVVAAIATSLSLWRNRHIRPLQRPHVWMLLFVLWASASMTWTVEPEKSFRRTLSYYQLFLGAWVVHQCCGTAERYRKLLLAFVCGCYTGFAGLMVNFAAGVSQGDGRYTAPGFDPNDLAVTLVLGIPAAWYLSVRTSSFRWLNRMYIPCAIVAALLTASRGALVTLAVCLLFPLLSRPKASVRSVLSGIVLLLVSAGLVLTFWSGISIRRLSTIGDQLNARDLNGRMEIWQRGMDAFMEHPLVGVGGGAFGGAVGARRSRELAAHNTMLGVAVEHGLVGLTLFMGVVFSLLRVAWRAPKSERKLWMVSLLAWIVAITTLSWENRELTWLMWGLCSAQPWLNYPAAGRGSARGGHARA
ncbi:MAG TPA: O-antigen ligase family protein [Bryobacteraceae bacterium]|nr:O-antigen ligase family protein [Bryobacteraceae bacterium]